MTTRRSIPLLTLAILLSALAPAAHAGPVGNQYLPQLPKAGGGHHHSSGSSGGTSSSYTPTTSESTQPTQTKQEKPAKPKHHEKATHVKVTPASANDSVSAASGGGAWVPLAVFAFAAVVSTAIGLALRRRAA
jgi:hypothetical protein